MGLADKGKTKPQVPTFEETGTLETEPEVKIETEPEAKVGTEDLKKVVTIDDIFDEYANLPKPEQKVQISIYLDKRVAEAFNKYGKKFGKGAKSSIINNFLKKRFFEE